MRKSPTSVGDGGRSCFGVFEFDASTLELRKSGRSVRIRPQSLRVLTLLLARPGELVSRADLQEAVWGSDTFVDYEQGVNQCIKDLRAALGDDAESPRYIETLARRGYRFIAPVQPVTTQAPLPEPISLPRRAQTSAGPERPRAHVYTLVRAGVHRWRRAAALGMALGALLVAVAISLYASRGGGGGGAAHASAVSVLPFTTQRANPALGIGLANAISSRLGGQQLVRIRSSLMTANGRTAEASETTASDVTLVLDGEMSVSGPILTVQAQLKNAGSGLVVWSDQFRVDSSELFSVEDVVAERVVAALGLRLAAAEQDRLRRRYTSNTAAYEEYLHGRAALVQYTPEEVLRAVEAFERALQRDPNYALARAGLAMACADMYLRFSPASEAERWGVRAEAEARAALDLDPDLAEAHLARAAVARKREFDWNATMSASRRALLLNPNLDQARFFMAAAYYHLGYMEEALIEMQKGRSLRGGDIVEPTRIEALVALFSGNFGSALVHLEEVSRLSSQAISDTYLALAAFYSGSPERARTMLESLAAHRSPATAMRSAAALAGVLAMQGHVEAARSQLGRVMANRYRDHHVAYSVGAAYAQLGEMAPAFQWLRTAADTGFPCLPWFERDPLLEPARRRAEFLELLTYVRLRRDSALAPLD